MFRSKSAMTALAAFTILNALSVSTVATAAPTTPSAITTLRVDAPRSAGPRASLRLDLGKTKAWVGQAIPITLMAIFRDVEGVTLEGAPQLVSKSLFTSNLSAKPHQSTQILDGQPTLTVTWKGTLTPSAPGPIELSVSLPARLQYRDAPASIAIPDVDDSDDDSFGNFGMGSFDPSAIFNQMRQRMRRMMERPLGNVRTQDITLKASARGVEALTLPALGQPATFTGAVGHFNLKASVSSARVQISEPVTLRIEVEGSGDLDRVDLAGVPGSDSWKAYPTAALSQPPTPDKRPSLKVFEQVLVPLRGGDLTVPAVAFTAFDPTTGQSLTRETAPLTVFVEGTAPAASSPTIGRKTAAASPIPKPKALEVLLASRAAILARRHVGFGVALITLLALAAAAYGALRRRGSHRSLYRRMRRAASEGQVGKFFESARNLIQAHLGKVWAMSPDQVTSRVIQERLGRRGEPLAELLLADETLRFARGGLESGNLKHLCSDVEHSLRAAS
jgi:hypothetical protein